MTRSRTKLAASAVVLFVLSLVATACGGTGTDANGAAGGADAKAASEYPKRPITWIVPYSPGGGSDRQVRRLQPHLEKLLDTKIRVVYKTGADGAVGWQALEKAEPDGYTISNVVLPNIIALEISTDNLGFKASDLAYISWTETTPNALVVAEDSKYDSLQEFVSAAKKNPGKLTIAGVGQEGKALIRQMTESIGIDISFVPFSGGVGAMVPQLQGGHVDAAYFGASHALEHPDTLKAIAISGEEPSKALEGVPTFQSKGYKGVLIGTSWGVAAPPGTPDAIVDKLNKAVNKAVTRVEGKLQKFALTPLHQSPKEAEQYVKERYDDVRNLLGKK